ncbi:AAA family ATPase [Alloacidobacterium dinghuense]|uniref:AAA family ATPase n=1 Tax=Alloacidobacterium dinghuense TaxID=2763107 RepID=A0A7G8BLU7_9BACT|nr:AAA family ATPase [Alloacidobacterium dinghuense]QNI33517.1 AAA family ATPase [Alloacidobacterium dinghuense]
MTTVWVLLAGAPATGKSTLARALSSRLGRCAILDKDSVRAVLFPGPMTDYTTTQDALCVQAMIEAASYMTRNQLAGYIIFDGRTFSRSTQIEEVITASEKAGAKWRILHLTVSDEVAETRLKSPDPEHPAGNRDAALYHRVKAAFEPITREKLDLDTSHGIDSILPQALAWLNT